VILTLAPHKLFPRCRLAGVLVGQDERIGSDPESGELDRLTSPETGSESSDVDRPRLAAIDETLCFLDDRVGEFPRAKSVCDPRIGLSL